MTAKEYVELAKRAAGISVADPLDQSVARLGGCWLFVRKSDHVVQATHLGEPAGTLLSAPLTSENVASEDALVRALLTSAMVCDFIDDTYLGEYGGPINSVFYCGLGDVTSYREGPNEATARCKFLDALLTPALDHGDA